MSSSIDPAAILQAKFGFDGFRPGQREVIEHLLAGRSAAAVFPTGAGKSLCYQVPALALEGVTLVVSPLIALMKDQIDALSRRGIEAARLDSSLPAADYAAVMQKIRSGKLRLLYVAPERFQNERFRETMAQLRISLFAVDEAHCISEWGHNFRPDYLKLVEAARQCNAERLLALTATATPKVLADIESAFGIEAGCAVRNSTYRPNLTLLTTAVTADERDQVLLHQLQSRPAGPTIVYVTLQRTAEEVANRLAEQGLAARAYHAGMKPQERSSIQEWFMASAAGIVVATIAFGMGIDKADIRYVYHYNMPKSLENYSQEIGRAGRDGKPAICEAFICPDDLSQLENFAYGDTPTLAAVRMLVEKIFGQPQSFDLSFYELSSETDIRLLVVRTLITYLELDGYLAGGTPFFSGYRFQPLLSSAEILKRFDGERRTFIAGLFRQVSKAKTWLHLDIDQASKRLNTTRDRIVRALDYLNDQGCLKVETSGLRHRFERLKSPSDCEQLACELHQRMVLREQNEIGRLRQFLEWVESAGCQVNALCAHFGESREEACGHCSRCLSTAKQAAGSKGSSKTKIAAREREAPLCPEQRPGIDANILQRAQSIRRQNPKVLQDNQNLARFLCGLTSPALTKAKLTSHELFGSLDGHRYGEVLERVASL